MTKSASAVALLALLGAAFVAPPAVAADPPTVTLTGSVDGRITELQEVIVSGVDASALSVRLEYPGVDDQVHTVDAGTVAPFYIETWGLGSNTRNLVVAQCDDAEGLTCGTLPSTTIATKVDNPDPTYDLSRPSPFSRPFDLTVHLVHTSGSPAIRLTTDAVTTKFVNPETATEIDTAALDEGAHLIDIAVCSADHARCAPGPAVPFDVVHTVPGTFSVSPEVFSPNGDGQFDTVKFEYTQQDAWEAAELEIRNAADGIVFQTPLDLPVAPLNVGNFTYDGKGTGGGYLPNGSYTATLRVSRTVDGQPIESEYNDVFTVDRTAVAPPKLTSSPSTFYPYVDGYRDTTKLTYASPEPYSRVDLKVRNAAGKLVRSKRILTSADRSWNGRRDDGSRAPEGKYSLRLRVVDKLGNVGLSPTALVTLRFARVVWVPRSLTVTPNASRVDGVIGSCSTRRTPSLHGWTGSAGYLSNTKCHTDFEASVVWTLHKVQLLRAATYRRVRLGWYGGPTRAATHDRAQATIYDTAGHDLGWVSSLDVMASQYINQTFSGAKVVANGYVQFGFQADSGNRYDLKSFTITYEAGYLR